MQAQRRHRRAGVLFALAGLLFVAAAAFLIVSALTGASDQRVRQEALPIAFALAVLGLVILVLWHRDRRHSEELAAESEAERARVAEELALARAQRERAVEEAGRDAEAREQAEQRVRDEQAERERERSEAEQRVQEERAEAQRRVEQEHREADERVRERERALTQERERRALAERGRQAEKAWTHELRAQVGRLQHENGVLGDLDDVRALVLRVATTLLEADKGILLSDEDADGNGRLDLVASHGFENDPENSAVADRFAVAVLERDATIREDDTSAIEADGRTAADEEITNLCAIPIYIQDEFSGVVVCANKDGGFGEFDDQVLLSLGDHAGAVLQNGQLQGELRRSYLATVSMLAEALEAKDPFLRGHSDEVSSYVAAVSRRLEIEPARREELVFGSLLHDVGKIGISERILLKPGALTPEERSVIQLHPRIGYRLVQQVPALRAIALAILHHHERFDGTGYPAGLRGKEIPLEARIICVADSFSAMTADRPYRRRVSLSDACSELERCAGTQFDPEIVRIFTEEVRCRPRSEETDMLAEALDDPELQLRRGEDEPILGHGSLAVIDNLTLLYTHRYFHEVAHSESERATVQDRPFAVVIIELTDLSTINRAQGYVAGDAAIQVVARETQRAGVRHAATACRTSGRRFALIVPGADEETAARVVAEVASDLADGPALRLGHAAWRPGDSGDDVIDRARLALAAGAPMGAVASTLAPDAPRVVRVDPETMAGDPPHRL